MTIQKLLPLIQSRASALAAVLVPSPVRRRLLPAILGCTALLTPAARAGMISTIAVGPANAPYKYNLTVEFLNSDYYNFILGSSQPTLTGYNFINTVASLTPGMSVNQTYYASFNAYVVSGITIGNDTNTGFASNYWAYWDGTATNPVQWSSDQTGESGRTLTPGLADGWVFGTGANRPQATSFAVPEPGTWTLVGLAMGGWLVYRVRRTRGVLPSQG